MAQKIHRSGGHHARPKGNQQRWLAGAKKAARRALGMATATLRAAGVSAGALDVQPSEGVEGLGAAEIIRRAGRARSAADPRRPEPGAAGQGGVIPAIPMPLFATAPMVPATYVPSLQSSRPPGVTTPLPLHSTTVAAVP